MTKAQSIGVLLKAAREKKNLSIEKVHQDTKMMPKIISAMEEDAFDKIGSRTYQESFLKKYARYLGVDASDKIASIFKPYEGALAAPRGNLAGAVEAPPRWVVPAVIMAVSVAAVVFLGIISFSHSEHVKDKKIQGKATAANKTAPFGNAAAAPEVKPVSFGSKGEPLKLALYAKEDVWVKVRSDGKVISQGVLTKGSKEKLEANNRFNNSCSISAKSHAHWKS